MMDAEPLLYGLNKEYYDATLGEYRGESNVQESARFGVQETQFSAVGIPEDMEKDGDGCCQHLLTDKENARYSIQEAIDHSGVGWFQVKLSIVSGLTWMADSMEIMLLSILGPVLSCQWFLQAWEQALLTTLVMTGMALGGSFWGSLADKYGRKTALTLSTVMIGYFGFLSSFSPMYIWMAVCRFLVGCALAAISQSAVLYSEYLPTKSRPGGLLLLAAFWAIGAAAEVTLAMLVLPTLGWRYLMAFSALPVLIFPTLSRWMPESARFYMACGRHKEASAMLETVARDNGKPMLEGTLSTADVQSVQRGQVKDMFSPSNRTLSSLVNILWFINGCLYYGIALLLPTLFNKPDGCHGNDIEKDEKDSCFVECKAFTSKDYQDLVVTAFADVPGLLVAFVLLQFMGRKKSIAVACVLFAASIFVCMICMSRSYLTALMFVARAMIAGSYQILVIYTTECYPTNIRAIGMGVASASSKVGALVTPYIAQVMTRYSASLSLFLYGAIGLLASLVALFLPFDTRGRAMVDVSH